MVTVQSSVRWPPTPSATTPTKANLVTVKVVEPAAGLLPVGANGYITLFSKSGTHLIVDVTGWFGDATAKGGYQGLLVPVSPKRVLDTRQGLGAPAGPLTSGATIDVTLAGTGGKASIYDQAGGHVLDHVFGWYTGGGGVRATVGW